MPSPRRPTSRVPAAVGEIPLRDVLVVQSLGGHGKVEFDELSPRRPSAARKGVVDLDEHPVGPRAELDRDRPVADLADLRHGVATLDRKRRRVVLDVRANVRSRRRGLLKVCSLKGVGVAPVTFGRREFLGHRRVIVAVFAETAGDRGGHWARGRRCVALLMVC
jgi:hypothetical protein